MGSRRRQLKQKLHEAKRQLKWHTKQLTRLGKMLAEETEQEKKNVNDSSPPSQPTQHADSP